MPVNAKTTDGDKSSPSTLALGPLRDNDNATGRDDENESDNFDDGDNDDPEYPAYVTCDAGRPDHGSNGAYPSWPAFALEALCYVDGNCSSAFEIMGSFADNTLEGPFGQVIARWW